MEAICPECGFVVIRPVGASSLCPSGHAIPAANFCLCGLGHKTVGECAAAQFNAYPNNHAVPATENK